MTLIGGGLLLKRRLTNPRVRATSSAGDILIITLLVIRVILGLGTIPFSAQHTDGSEMMKLVGWAQSVVTFQGVHQSIWKGLPLSSACTGAGYDTVPDLPVLPSGAYLECAG